MSDTRKTPQSPPNRVYLFIGEDEFRKRLSLERFKSKLLKGKTPDIFDFEQYSGKDSKIEDIIRSLDTISFSSNAKTVVLKEPQLLSQDSKTRLLKYIENRDLNGSNLIFYVKGAFSKANKFHAAVSKLSQVLNFAKLGIDEISSWVIKEFKLRDKTINRRDANLLSETLRQDLDSISSSIEQLSLFVGSREKITYEDILQFGDLSSEVSAFELLNSIQEKDAGASLRILKSLLSAESNPPQIIGLLSWHIARLVNAKKMLARKISKREMSVYLKVGSFTLNKLISQAGSFSLIQLKRQLDTLLETDRMLKRSNINNEYALEMLIAKLTA
ncbi:DNA polymerase III subunit delta [Candidatus Omnitrophota bacterium]